jgi:hypothetical protein
MFLGGHSSRIIFFIRKFKKRIDLTYLFLFFLKLSYIGLVSINYKIVNYLI